MAKTKPNPPEIFDCGKSFFDNNDLFGLFMFLNIGKLQAFNDEDINYKYSVENGARLFLYEKGGYSSSCSVQIPIVYFDADGHAWTTEISYKNKVSIYHYSRASYSTSRYVIDDDYLKTIDDLTFTPWKQQKGIANCAPIQCSEELWGLLTSINPYGAKFAKENRYTPEALLWCPFIEILDKAGYAKVHSRIYFHLLGGSRYNSHLVEFNRLCKNGNSPKEIFQTSKSMYTVLKNEESLVVWDTFRKLDKFARIPKEDYERFYNMGFYKRDLKKVYSLLSAKDMNGKPIFPSLDSFMLYFDKISMYEAVGFDEGVVLLLDYINMCKQLGVLPNLDSDSLKREHDVMARLCREKKDETIETKLNAACKKLERFDYEEDNFLVRGVRNYDDLIDEARQQRSCLASYAHYIADHKSLIYVMREKKNPDKSLITIELTPDLKIRQKKMACNRQIKSKAQSDFINRWVKHIKAI